MHSQYSKAFRNLPLGVTIMLGEPFSNGSLKAQSTVGADEAKKQIKLSSVTNTIIIFTSSFCHLLQRFT